jgi:hypothetical protein
VCTNNFKEPFGKLVDVVVGIKQLMENFSLWPTYTWKYWLETRKVNPLKLFTSKQMQNNAA